MSVGVFWSGAVCGTECSCRVFTKSTVTSPGAVQHCPNPVTSSTLESELIYWLLHFQKPFSVPTISVILTLNEMTPCGVLETEF